MNTRPQEALLYRDLARQQAQISRQIGLAALPRLTELLADASDIEAGRSFDVELRFSVDSQGCTRVDGEISGSVLLNCHRCAEVLRHPLQARFSCMIAQTEAIADSLVEEGRSGGDSVPAEDVLVANGNEVTVAQIVEDELLLNLPERLCVSEPCERAPELAYPADLTDGKAGADGAGGQRSAGTGEDTSGEADNPFSVLANLKLGRSPEE
jgi:uncharacterized metal-binding protein YceD (DUF177 family)